MRRTATALLATCLLTGLTTGCSSESAKPAVAKATGKPSASRTPSSTPSPRQETFRFGDTADISVGGRDFSATALVFKDQGITGDPGLQSDGQKWALAEVKVCNQGTKAFPVSPFAWTLAYPDGTRMEATHVSAGLPEPLYPADAKVKGGDCVRGNVTFEVPLSGRAERLVYSPEDLDEPVEWRIGK
ncbi:DUF4352 domain-containing protein [Streptomyces sp. NPDC056486]|uniref:DUF4352 domain-containing protein n=1 Tax=Streptomyces sp. NPDC056486 TaxID=3345835 RepID=UPI00367734C6